ncbi:MAG: translocated intimin receptor Tir [bacterium]
MNKSILKTIFTDSHFWLPAGVLVVGILLLVYLH